MTLWTEASPPLSSAFSLFTAQATSAPEFTPLRAVVIVGGFLVVFVLFWCGIAWLLSRVGGWHRLAQHYDASDRPASGHRVRFVSGMVGATSYRHVLTIHLDTDGLYLDVNRLYRVGHPRLFIPWSEIAERTPRKMLLKNMDRLTIGRPKVGTVSLPAELLSASTAGLDSA